MRILYLTLRKQTNKEENITICNADSLYGGVNLTGDKKTLKVETNSTVGTFFLNTFR
jgi:hypothetical protein